MNFVQVAGMWMQDTGSLSGNSKLLIIFVAMVAFAMMAQAVTLIIMAIGAAKTRKHLMEMGEELRLKLMPIIDSTQEIIRDNGPKIKVITENFAETSHVVRAKAQEIDVTLSDVNQRTRTQVARVDGMVSSVLTTTAHVGNTVHEGIRIPLREISGVVNGLKVGLDVLTGRVKRFGSGRQNGRDSSL